MWQRKYRRLPGAALAETGEKGSVYTACHSINGLQWEQVGNPVDIGFGNGTPVYAGLAITSHNNGILSTATVDNYAINGVLQLTLQSFTGNLTLNKTVALQWTTTLEKNIQNFVVERSTDSIQYTAIDTVMANNNGSFVQTYNYEGQSPAQGVNFYRLLITSSSDTTTYSPVVKVYASRSSAPIVFPNPASGVVHIAHGNEAIKFIRIYDVGGRLLAQVNNASTINDIPVHALANGIYFLEITASSSVYKQKVIVKN